MGNRADDDNGGGGLDVGEVGTGGKDGRGGMRERMGGGEEKLSFPNSSLIFRG